MPRETNGSTPDVHLHMNIESRVYENGRTQAIPIPRWIENNPSWESHRNPQSGTLEYQKDFGDDVYVLNDFSLENGSTACVVNVFDYNTGEHVGQLGGLLHAEVLTLAGSDADKLIALYRDNGRDASFLNSGDSQPEALKETRDFHAQRREIETQRNQARELVGEFAEKLDHARSLDETKESSARGQATPEKKESLKERAARCRNDAQDLQSIRESKVPEKAASRSSIVER